MPIANPLCVRAHFTLLVYEKKMLMCGGQRWGIYLTRNSSVQSTNGQPTSLPRPNGIITEDVDEIMEITNAFYKDLIAPQTSYSGPSFSMGILTCIQPQLSRADQSRICRPLDKCEQPKYGKQYPRLHYGPYGSIDVKNDMIP